MKKENSKPVKKEESYWIDVHNDNAVREAGIMRPFVVEPRDKSVWTKTADEHKALRNVRRRGKSDDMHFHSAPAGRKIVRTKLIIQLKRNKKFPKSTYSFECFNTDIDRILGKFQVVDSKSLPKSLIVKYSYNGTTYKPEERPCFG